MPENQRSALDAGKEISSSIDGYQARKQTYRSVMVFIVKAAIAIACIYGVYAVLAWFLQLFGVNWGTLDPALLFSYVSLVALLLVCIGFLWLWNYDNTSQSIHLSYALLMKASSTVEAMGAKRHEALQNTRRIRFADFETRYTRACQGIEQNLQKSLARYTSTVTRYVKEDGLLVAGWDDPRWRQWQQHRQARSLVRLGVVMESPGFPPLPALAICPGGENILFKIPGVAKECGYILTTGRLRRAAHQWKSLDQERANRPTTCRAL